MQITFFIARLFENMHTTEINAKGLLPMLMKESGFITKKLYKTNTIFGTLRLYKGIKKIDFPEKL